MTCSCREILLQQWLKSLIGDLPVHREGYDGFDLWSYQQRKRFLLTNKGNTPKNNFELRWIRTPPRWQQVGGQTEGEVAVKQDQDTSHRLKGNHHRFKKKTDIAHNSKTIFSSDGAAWADFQDRWHFQKPLKNKTFKNASWKAYEPKWHKSEGPNQYIAIWKALEKN